MLYRIIIGVLLIVGLLVAIVLPANAEVFTYQDYISDMQVDGDTQIVSLAFDDSFAEGIFFVFRSDKTSYMLEGYGEIEVVVDAYDPNKLNTYFLQIGLFGEDGFLSTDGIPDGALFSFDFVVSGIDDKVHGTYAGIDGYPCGEVFYYNWVDDELSEDGWAEFNAGIYEGPYIPSFRFSFDGTLKSGYDALSIYASIVNMTFEYEGSYIILCEDVTMTMTFEQFLDSDLSESEKLMGEMRDQLALQGKKLDEVTGELSDLNDKVDDLGGKVEELPGQIGDEMQDIVDQEKNEANSSGNSSVDNMIDIIPDYSTGLIEGVKNLASAMSYEGTECILTMPALTIPALPGVTDQPVTFLAEQKVNFEDWFNRMPSAIMAVTKAFFDIAVVGYCFYEFYSLVNELTNGGKKLE